MFQKGKPIGRLGRKVIHTAGEMYLPSIEIRPKRYYIGKLLKQIIAAYQHHRTSNNSNRQSKLIARWECQLVICHSECVQADRAPDR